MVRTLEGVEQAAERARDLESRGRFIRDVLGRYVSEKVVGLLLDSPEGLRLGGERRLVTAMMVDVRGFSHIAETLPPEEVVSILNHYLASVIEVIELHDGMVNEIMGDGLLVIFGAPLASGSDARSAIECALDLQETVQTLNHRIPCNGWPGLSIGIRIHTGVAVVGNIGSAARAKYAAVRAVP